MADMSEYTCREHLEYQLRHAYRAIRQAVEGLNEAQAYEGARPDWRRYRWGVGLDGSIAGIVWHAAAWKQIFAAGLETGTFAAESEAAPADREWATLRDWLADGQAHLQTLFQGLSDATLAEVREWEGIHAPVARLLSFVIEHDVYHAGQIELLRQLRGYPRVED